MLYDGMHLKLQETYRCTLNAFRPVIYVADNDTAQLQYWMLNFFITG